MRMSGLHGNDLYRGAPPGATWRRGGGERVDNQPGLDDRCGMPSPSVSGRVALALAGVALAAYGGLTLWPPGPVLLYPPPFDASLLERLFPGVPVPWTVARLACVGAAFAVAFVAALLDRRAPAAEDLADRPPAWPALHPGWATAAVAAAGLHVLAVPLATSLPRAGQIAWIAWLAVPTLLAAIACRASAPSRTVHRDPVSWPLVVAVVLVWGGLNGPSALHSALMATPTDSIIPFEGAQRVLDPHFDLLGGQQLPGYTSLLMVLQGPLLAGVFAEALTPQLLQVFQIGWTMVAALLVARIVAAFGVPGAAPVAAAAYLFAPFTTATTILLGPIFLGALIPGLLLTCGIAAVREHRGWAVVACGAVAGAATTHPSIAPACVLAALALVAALRRDPPPWPLAIAAVASFAAAALPGLPNPLRLASLATSYVDKVGMWAGIEALALGMVPTEAAEFQVGAGWRGPFDALLGVVLSPWVTPRTAARLWGDTAFEPIGAALFTFGLAAALAGRWRGVAGRGLLAFLAAVAFPGVLTSYDRPSLTRALALPLAFALVSGFGFAWLLRARRPRLARGAGIAGAAAIVVVGTLQFDVVNRSILPMSAVSLAIAEVDGDSGGCRDAVLLNTAAFDVQASAFFATNVPRCPFETVVVQPDESAWIDAVKQHGVAFWSPGVEEIHAVARRLCAADPGTQLWMIRDRTGVGRVHAAARGESGWRPRHAAELSGCSEEPETESHRARRALEEAQHLAAQGEAAAAVDRLRRTAATTFIQRDLYLELARSLAQDGSSARDRREALYWGRRAVQSDDWRNVDAILALARLQADAGDAPAARATLERGIAESRGRQDAEGERRLAAEAAALGLTSALAVVGPWPSC
jgi:hypothetical protein